VRHDKHGDAYEFASDQIAFSFLKTNRPLRKADIAESMNEDPPKHEYRVSRENLEKSADTASNRLFLGELQESNAAERNQLWRLFENGYRRLLVRLTHLPTSALDRLSRYEHMLWRQARQIVFTLESLRRRMRYRTRSTFPFSFRRREPGVWSDEFR